MTLLASWPSVIDDDGTKTFGTIFNLALTNAIKASVEDNIHSTVNSTIKTKTIIDEVVAARGSLVDLVTRLNVTTNADGTPKSVAGQATNADLQSQIASRNVALNGDFDSWPSGAALAPENFVLAGAAGTIARTGAGEADTYTFGTGTYAAKITRAGTNVTLTQTVISAANMPGAADYKGKKVAVFAKGKTAIASHLRIVIDDGVTTSATDYHTGGGAAEDLSKVHQISASATKLDVYVSVESSNGSAYVGGLTIVFSNLAPTSWKPLSGIADASISARGVVNTGAQTFGGVKTFNTPPAQLGLFARLTADFVKSNSTVFGDVTGMSFPIAANEVWDFEFVIMEAATAVADSKFTLTGPAAPTSVWFDVHSSGPVLSTTSAVAFGTAVSVANSGAAARQFVVIRGMVRNGANAGTVQLQFAQNTAEVSNATVFAESYMNVFRRP